MTDPTAFEPLSDFAYDTLAQATLARVEAEVDRLLEEDVADIDAARTGGLLELRFADGRVVVVNTQPPLHELWLASPAGGFHFRHAGGRWLDTKSGAEFYAVLGEAASGLVGRTVVFTAG